MNPLSVSARGYRSFDELELDLPEGCLAIIGENGAGKSSIVNLVDLCLFGPESRSLEGYLADDGAEALEIELAFEHAGELYRVRRGYSDRGRGKTTLDFERSEEHMVEAPIRGDMDPDEFPAIGWMPLTRESQKETQTAIEEILGLARETFRASAFLAQGDGAAFTEASPRDRKAILAQVLGLQVWDRLREAAGGDRRHTERLVSELAGRISLLEETAGDRDELEEACSRLRLLVSACEEKHAAREQALHDAAVAAQDAEKAEATHAARRSAVLAAQAALSGRQAVVDRAAAAKREAVEIQRALSDVGDPEARLAALEERRAEYDAANEGRREAERERDRLFAEAGGYFEQSDRLSESVAPEIRAKIAEIEQAVDAGETPRCDRCEQELHREARMRALRSLQHELADIQQKIADLNELGAGPHKKAMTLAIPDAPQGPEYAALVDEIKAARAAELTVAAAQARLESLEAAIAEVTPELADELARLNEALADAEAALAEFPEPEPGAVDRLKAAALVAKAELDEVANRLADARGESIRTDAKLEQTHKIAVELADCQARREALHGELELLTTLERAYGRDGIPALIVEASAIPSIETEASRILAELGTSYRVELRTQRVLRSGDGLAETLDVVVIGEAGERAYETFSGGERTRINLALRIALARLLAHRRGAESKLLAIDEPEFLDEAGTAQLAEVLRGLESEFSRIILVSHAPTLRDAFDQTIEVEKVDGRSRIVGAREAVAA